MKYFKGTLVLTADIVNNVNKRIRYGHKKNKDDIDFGVVIHTNGYKSELKFIDNGITEAHICYSLYNLENRQIVCIQMICYQYILLKRGVINTL